VIVGSKKNLNCVICDQNASADKLVMDVIWVSPSWVLLHDSAPSPVSGWLTLQPQRCVQGVSKLTEEEALQFGGISRKIARGIEVVLDVPKVYSISFGESVSHLHCHFVPRYLEMPPEYLAFGVADLFRDTKSGLREPADSKKTKLAIHLLRDYFSVNPPIVD
jgi:diadenosine tetraphosphate (Ap4A) HIT family hydrolase